jgi:hypothetical protein
MNPTACLNLYSVVVLTERDVYTRVSAVNYSYQTPDSDCDSFFFGRMALEPCCGVGERLVASIRLSACCLLTHLRTSLRLNG